MAGLPNRHVRWKFALPGSCIFPLGCMVEIVKFGRLRDFLRQIEFICSCQLIDGNRLDTIALVCAGNRSLGNAWLGCRVDWLSTSSVWLQAFLSRHSQVSLPVYSSGVVSFTCCLSPPYLSLSSCVVSLLVSSAIIYVISLSVPELLFLSLVRHCNAGIFVYLLLVFGVTPTGPCRDKWMHSANSYDTPMHSANSYDTPWLGAPPHVPILVFHCNFFKNWMPIFIWRSIGCPGTLRATPHQSYPVSLGYDSSLPHNMTASLSRAIVLPSSPYSVFSSGSLVQLNRLY